MARKSKDHVDPLDTETARIRELMSRADPQSPEYMTLMTHLERLTTLRTENRPERVSRDTIALIAGNLMGILIIVAYEQKHVVKSKGFEKLIRPKYL